MRPRRFDKQLQFVFTVLCALTLLVGATSILINRELGKAHEAVLAETIAVIRRAERVGVDADLARSLAERLVAARTEAEVARAGAALTGRIAGIGDGIVELRRFLAEDGGDLAEAVAARDLVPRMMSASREVIRADAAARAEAAGLRAAGGRLASVISAQTDLARLRITAGIWQMYAAPPGRDVRPALDRLADRDFFAYERIGELSEATAQLSRLVQRAADEPDRAALPGLRAEFEDTLRLARARAAFLPSRSAARTVGQELDLYAAAIEAGGLLPLRGELLGAGDDLQGLSVRLGQELDALTEEARLGRDAARARMAARIADTGWRAAMLTILLATLTGMGLLGGGLVWLYARNRIVARLGVVSSRIVEVARGDTGAAMRISGHDEIGRLEKAVNVLRRRTEEAARLRESLEAAVLARTADVVAEMDLANAARAEAEAASRAKTHFLARMSHEIRTPLNGVVGLVDLLLADEPDPARRDRLRTALTSAQDLRVLTDDILAFASHEDGRPGPDRAAFDPARLARHLGEHLRALAAGKGLAATVRIPEDLPPALLGEPLRIRQVVGNLLSNAVKYTDAGEVRLEVEHEPGGSLHGLAFTVTDTGIGMTAQEALDAFDIYRRTDAARRKGVQGVGLGLAIARQLTDAMGGELRVGSEPGRGSRLSLRLRLPAADPADLPRDAEALPALPPRRVLVVDDHPVNRLVARGYLERMGCAVEEAATGAAALDFARRGTFDAILIDLDLPDLPGAEVAARLDRKGARVAVLTADLVADDAATRARFGVDHVLSKPIAVRALIQVLSETPAAPAPAPGGEPVPAEVEATLRDDLRELGAPLVAEIVAGFLDDLSAAVPRLLSADDDEARRRAAHRLKGASANFALSDLCDLLRRIEAGDRSALGLLAPAAGRAAQALRAAALRCGLQVPSGGAKQ